jgi:REP element-mobilizing transposase RayT
LVAPLAAKILRDEWSAAESRHGWQVGRFVIMPDHVHFFAVPTETARPLGQFVGRWKEWTAKAIIRAFALTPPLWQHRFFDHVLRSMESYAEKWEYVRQNPVRAGLVERVEDWPYAGHVHFDSWCVS